MKIWKLILIIIIISSIIGLYIWVGILQSGNAPFSQLNVNGNGRIDGDLRVGGIITSEPTESIPQITPNPSTQDPWSLPVSASNPFKINLGGDKSIRFREINDKIYIDLVSANADDQPTQSMEFSMSSITIVETPESE